MLSNSRGYWCSGEGCRGRKKGPYTTPTGVQNHMNACPYVKKELEALRVDRERAKRRRLEEEARERERQAQPVQVSGVPHGGSTLR